MDLAQRRAAVATRVHQAERQHGEHARNFVITRHGEAAVQAAELAFALAACLDVDTSALARHDNATQILLLQLLVAAHRLVRDALGFQAAHNSLGVAAQALRELEIAAVDRAAASSANGNIITLHGSIMGGFVGGDAAGVDEGLVQGAAADNFAAKALAIALASR